MIPLSLEVGEDMANIKDQMNMTGALWGEM